MNIRCSFSFNIIYILLIFTFSQHISQKWHISSAQLMLLQTHWYHNIVQVEIKTTGPVLYIKT